MESKFRVPVFATEAEEAEWWYENRERVSDEFARAAAEGRLGHGTAARLAGLAPKSAVFLDQTDIARAKSLAERRGVQYQRYIENLIHDAIERDERLAS